MNTECMFSSATCEWATPEELFRTLDAEFGFTCDVCATADNAKCAEFYSPEQDGLAQEWTGVCWCNPPTVDAVPVVRCKDCLYWNSAIGFCHQNSQYYNGGESWDIYQPDDFCSRGERRTT